MENKLEAKILVIDDERDIRDGCKRILSRLDMAVLTAQDGPGGLEMVQSHQIAIVICDIKMPGMDGIEVLSRIKHDFPDIMVIMITGFSTVETAIEAMKNGAYDFISKPFTPDQLRIVVRRALEKLKLTQEAALLKEERQKNLADLMTEQSRIRTIIETLPDGVMVTNIAGQVVLMNPLAREYLGQDTDQCIGKNIEACIEDSGFCDYIRKISACRLEPETQLPTYELLLPEQRFIMVRGRPVLGTDGACMGAVLTLSDITALKVFDRLKSEFVAKVSHELRSPLSIIHEQLAMVLKGHDLDESDKSQYLLGRAKEKTQTLISLIGDLLDISRIEAGKSGQEPVEVNIGELLGRIVDFVSSQAEGKKQTLHLDLDLPENGLSMVRGDPIALESIFGNLITNAIKYTPEKGDIHVRLSNTGNQMIQVDVSDNGYGIEERHLAKIFDKFYRIKDDNTRFINGTGLGLPIVKSLVESMNGSVSVESTPGKGSVFTIQLPAGKN